MLILAVTDDAAGYNLLSRCLKTVQFQYNSTVMQSVNHTMKIDSSWFCKLGFLMILEKLLPVTVTHRLCIILDSDCVNSWTNIYGTKCL